ncbi:MAG: hypothetical protein WC483_02860 [Candidatus Paceibacterota bacterium]|jgi:hypothetical protein|nr:hypothetical protein [Candidatus Paceibacterota bacterium]
MFEKATFICNNPKCGHACEFVGTVTNLDCPVLHSSTEALQIEEVKRPLFQRLAGWFKKGVKL